MQARTPRLLSALAILGSLVAAPLVRPASADPVHKLLQGGGVPYVLYLVKDLGGGAYWNITTSSMYALETGSGILIDGADTAADLLATTAANGRDLLLLINGAVLVPVGNAF